MKKAGRLYVLITYLCVCGLLNLILFLTVNNDRLSEGVFWLAWVFAFPVGIALALFSYFYTGKGEIIAKAPVAHLVTYSASAVFLVVGIVFMYFNITSFVFPIIFYSFLVVALVIFALPLFFAASTVSANQKYTRDKVLFIRMLKVDLEDCLPYCKEASLANAINGLAEAVRFSDPMSHPSLAGVEAELTAAAAALKTLLQTNDTEAAQAKIGQIKALIESRNSRCKMLK